jgi:hypothetical protein
VISQEIHDRKIRFAYNRDRMQLQDGQDMIRARLEGKEAVEIAEAAKKQKKEADKQQAEEESGQAEEESGRAEGGR